MDEPATGAKQYFKTAVFTNGYLARNSVGRVLAKAFTLTNHVEQGCMIMATCGNIESNTLDSPRLSCFAIEPQTSTPQSPGIFLEEALHQNWFRPSQSHCLSQSFHLGPSLQKRLHRVQWTSDCFAECLET